MLEISQVSRHFEGVRAVDDVSFRVDEGEFVSIIGPNGAGKTTLFNLITGTDKPTAGAITYNANGKAIRLDKLKPYQFARLGIARTFQHGRTFANLSVLDNVLVGAHARRRARNPLLEVIAALVPPAGLRDEESQLRREAEEIIALFGERLTPRLDHPASSLSYANRRRVELARALALRPRLLLLDEPTAGMNPTETEEILQFILALKKRGLTILLIEHKLSLVMALSDRVVVMDNGQKIAEDAPEVVRHDPRVIEAYLGHKQHARESVPQREVQA
jgi:branched-chain amino acid transport system ATP-binding protein